MRKRSKGYVHVYTGNGKGKTTAAFGFALRAHYAGWKVYVGQFVKDMAYHETQIQCDCSDFLIEQLGRGCFITRNPLEADVCLAKESLKRCAALLREGYFDLVILDEITIALYYHLLEVGEVIEALVSRASHVEVVLTGRYAPRELIEFADLVTEMSEVKHYYKKGVLARDGVER